MRVSSVTESRLEIVCFVLDEDLARCGHHLAAPAAAPVQGAAAPVARRESLVGSAGTSPTIRMTLDVLLGVEQHAVRLLLVSASAALFLQVVLQRGRNVRVDHQSHVGLVDAHPERVVAAMTLRSAFDEALLDGLLLLRRQSGMKTIGRNSLLLEEIGDPLGTSAGRAVHNRPTCRMRREVMMQRRQDVLLLGRS